MSAPGMGMKILHELYERDMGICQICQRTAHILDCNVDHVVPLAKGGTNGLDNLQLTHIWCNSKKGDDTGNVILNRYWREVPTKRALRQIDREVSAKVPGVRDFRKASR